LRVEGINDRVNGYRGILVLDLDKKLSADNINDFQRVVLVHLDAAYNYAYYLSRNQHDAEDLTQEACSRAFAAFDRLEQKNVKAWLFTIVRNAFYNQKQKDKHRGEVVYLTNSQFEASLPESLKNCDTPEEQLIRDCESEQLKRAINKLAEDYREVIILREIEELSYAEIALVIDCALGTVMSRLSRARKQLKKLLKPEYQSMGSLS